MVAYGRLKTKENFKLLAEKWSRSLTRGSKYSDLTGKLSAFCKTVHLREVVATAGSTVVAIFIRNTWCKLDNLQGRYKELSNHSVSQSLVCTHCALDTGSNLLTA